MTAIFYLLTLILPLVTILIVFAMRYYAVVQQAKAQSASGDAYRQFAETASAAQSKIAASLAAMEADLSDVRTRMAAVEVILKTVE